MFDLTRLIHLSSGADRDGVLNEIRTVTAGAEHALVQPTLPGVRNGGDILVHLRFDNFDQRASVAAEFDSVISSPGIRHIDGAEYLGTPHRGAPHSADAVYRTLLLRIAPGTQDDTVAQFEEDLRLLPRFVPAINAWQLSRVESAVGSVPWTHVFEQEFASLDGLTGPYLMHPVHWAFVDRWFDPECPEVIVRDRVCHSFCRCPSPVLSPG
ncbi:MAG TPA: Dabb family protein [Mycobacterium sp.]|nr:Dabb family protein [Mycobacterium sp.]